MIPSSTPHVELLSGRFNKIGGSALILKMTLNKNN